MKKTRAPELKKKIGALEQEQQSLKMRAVEDQRWMEMNQSMNTFLSRLNQAADKLTNVDRQKIVRLLVKQIDVGKDTITIHHSIPFGQGHPIQTEEVSASSPLYKRRLAADSCRFLASPAGMPALPGWRLGFEPARTTSNWSELVI